MKLFSVFLLSLFLSTSVYARNDTHGEKPFSLGLGLYRSVISVDDSQYANDELSGIGLSVAYAISDQFGLRGTYFSLEHDDFSAIDSTGFDIVAYLGTGLDSNGFKGYVGGGFFKDKWQAGGFSESFSGLQLNGGLGYNWQSVSLDFILGIRDAGDYEDFVNEVFGDNVTAAAVTGMILLSARF